MLTQSDMRSTEGKSILIIDDNSKLAKSILDLLRQNRILNTNCQIAASAVGLEAALRERTWDVIICKYSQKPFETTELIRLAQKFQPQSPVIIVGKPVTIQEAFELGYLGAQELIEPSDSQHLFACIQQILSSKAAVGCIAATVDSSIAQQLNLVLDSMEDAILLISLPDRSLIFTSSSFERVLGYPAEVFLEDMNYYKKIIPVDEVDRATAAMQAVFQNGSAELEHRVIWPNGEVHWVQRRAWIIYDSQGIAIQLIDIARDITARKRAEEELLVINRKQRTLLDNLPDFMFHVHADGTILDFHGPAAKSVIPIDQVLGKNIRDFINSRFSVSDVAQQTLEGTAQVRFSGQPHIFEYMMEDQRYYEARMLPIEGTDEIMILARDITNRKEYEARLRESESKYRTLLESTDTLITMFDRDGTVLYANERAADAFGWTTQQMIGKALHELFPPEIAETQLTDIRSVIDSGSGKTVEAKTIIAGRELWYRTSIQPVRGVTDTVNAALVNSSDITPIRTAEAALRRSMDDLQQQKSFLEILLGISSRFITLPMDGLNDVMASTLEEIGLFLHADRMYIFDCDFARATVTNTYEWCAEGIKPQIDHLQEVPIERIDIWMSILRRGEIIKIRNVGHLDPQDAMRNLLEPQDIQSLLIVPLMEEGVCIGFVGLDAVRTQRNISDSDQQLMQLFAQLLINIRGRIAMLKALEASEKRFRQIVETAQEGVWLIDLDGNTIYVNQRMADMLGYYVNEVLDSNFYSFMDEDARQKAQYYLERRRQGVQEQHDFRFKRKDGSDLWVIINTNPILDDSQQPTSVLGMLVDITNRKKAEEALRRSEAYLRSLVNSEAALNVRTDLQGKITYCNDRYRRQFAWAAPSIIGTMLLDDVHPDDLRKVHNAVDSCFANPTTTVQFEIRKRVANGDYIWTLWEFSAVTNSEGVIQEVQGVGFDINQQKQAEKALHEANQLLEQRVQERTAELQEERNLLRTVIDAIPDYIYVKDRQHRVLLNNLAHTKSFGTTKGEEIIGRTDFDLYPQTLAIQYHADEDRIFETEQGIINLEEQSIGPDGNDRWVLSSKVLLRSVQGKVIGLVGITRDITAIKAASDALRFSEERYRATMAAMSEGLILHGEDSAIELSNSAAERILGLTSDQMIGRTPVDPRWHTIHEDGSPFPGEMHPAIVSLRTGEPQSNIIMGIHKPDDTLTWILVNSQPLATPAKQKPYAVAVTFADITMLKEAEVAIKATLAHEREISELKSRFVSMASHEFRTPLASILASTETLTQYWDRMDKKKINDRLNRIREQVSRMTRIMEEVLELTRMQMGRTKFAPVQENLDTLNRHIVSELSEIPGFQDRIHYVCSPQPLKARFDPYLLRKVITNLLHNALKYSAPETQVQFTVVQASGQITLCVSDKGIGIPPQDLQRLSEPFHRAANVGAISGTGLGLAIVKEAVELHRGTMTVDSQVNVGTTVTVTLPDQSPNDTANTRM